jgi:hypothetical protein
MKYKTLKPLYCPLSQRRITPGEYIEIPEQHLQSYKGFVEIIETATIEPVVEVAIKPKSKKKR